MNAPLEIVPSVLDRIRRTLVGLKMPRALEVLDQTVRHLDRGDSSALEMIDTLFAEELTLRENRRVKMALRMAKLSTINTLAGFDFTFSRHSTRTAFSRWPNSILSSATRCSISLARREPIPGLSTPVAIDGNTCLDDSECIVAISHGRNAHPSSPANRPCGAAVPRSGWCVRSFSDPSKLNCS